MLNTTCNRRVCVIPMSGLSKTSFGSTWLNRFPKDDQKAATLLMDEILLVGRDTLAAGLQESLQILVHQTANHPIALYVEREIPKIVEGKRPNRVVRILPLFCTEGDGRRAIGNGPPAILPNDSKEVGSEGPLANFITDACRRNAKALISHPGPDLLRSKRVRTIVIISDFIGSGQRVFDMLEAFWLVRTIRS